MIAGKLGGRLMIALLQSVVLLVARRFLFGLSQAHRSRLDVQRSEVADSFPPQTVGGSVTLRRQRGRMFLIACAELLRYGGGDAGFVGHDLFGGGR